MNIRFSHHQAASFAVFCGIAGPLVIGLGILISAAGYKGVTGQTYSPLNHFVSELGEVGVSDLAEVFNTGLVIGGAMALVFMVYLAGQVDHWLRYPLGVLGALASLSGLLVGVFPMNMLMPHLVVAMTFFNLGMLVAFLYSLTILFNQNHPFPRWLGVPGLFSSLTFLTFLLFPPEIGRGVDFQTAMAGFVLNRPDFIALALNEWIVIVGVLLWIFVLAVFMHNYRRRSP